MRIAIYTTALNNNVDAEIREWCDTAIDADYRFVFDLGSSDGTDRQLEMLNCVVIRGHDSQMRSDDALNAALAMLPADVDVCFRVDLNERPQPNWKESLLAAWQDVPALSVLLSDANVGARYYEPRIHARRGFRWSGPLCERLIWRGHETFAAPQCNIGVERRNAPGSDRIALLREGVDEFRQTQRSFRYAEALLQEGYLQDGLDEIQRHIALRGPAEETAYLWRLASSVDEPNAHRFLIEAQQAFSSASNYLGFAEHHFRNQEWGQAYSCCQYALSLLRSKPQKHLSYTDDLRLRGARLHDLASTAAWNLWDFEAAYGHAIEALRRDPLNSILINQINVLSEAIANGATLDPDMENVQVPEPKKISVEIIRSSDINLDRPNKTALENVS